MPTRKAPVMRQVWQALGKSWVTLLSLGSLLGTVELLTNVVGIAGDLYATLEPSAVHAVRLVAFAFLPVVGGVTLVGVARVLRRVVHIVDRLIRNDRWARRELMACLQEIRYCLDRLEAVQSSFGYHTVSAGVRLRLGLLVGRLHVLGIVNVPPHNNDISGWIDRLDQLEVCAAAGNLRQARQIAQQWAVERREA